MRAVLISGVVPFMLKTPDNPEGVPQPVFDEMTASMKKDRAHFFKGFFQTFYGDGLLSHPVSDELIENSMNVAMTASLKATLACAEAFATTDFRPDLPAFTVPTMLIHGTADKTVPIDASARQTIKAVPQAILHEYEGEPHGLFATAKERLIGDLLEFLKK